MMISMPPTQVDQTEPILDHVIIERERDRFAGRALSSLVLLNGAAALVLLAILAQAEESTVEPKFAAAMMFFSGGAVAALLSAFIAYINRTLRMEAPRRASLRRGLRFLAIAAVIGSGAAFLIGMNMVGAASSEKSSTHPKGPKEKQQQRAPVVAPSERVQLFNEADAPAGQMPGALRLP